MNETPVSRVPRTLGWRDMMAGQPDVDWLIEGVLPSGSRAMVFADSGTGKSFTTIDMALHISTGKPWQGRVVKQGPVYYLAAENASTLYARVAAWEAHHKGHRVWEKQHQQQGETEPPIYFITEPVDLTSHASVDALLGSMGHARLVVIDTLLTSMGAGDIKDTSESYRAIAQVNRIIAETGATVLLVHHTPDKGKNPLGGSAWRGGLQVRMWLTRQRGDKNLPESADFQDGDTVTLRCEKLTHSAHFDPIKLPVRLVRVKRGVMVPILAAGTGKRQRRASRPRASSAAHAATPAAKPAAQAVDFEAAYAECGDDRARLAALTGLSAAAIRQRLSRRNRAQREVA